MIEGEGMDEDGMECVERMENENEEWEWEWDEQMKEMGAKKRGGNIDVMVIG